MLTLNNIIVNKIKRIAPV